MTAPSHRNDFAVITFLGKDDDDVPLAVSLLLLANSRTTSNPNSTALVLHESSGTSNRTANQSTPIINCNAEAQELMNEVEVVKRDRIAGSTRKQYCAANVSFNFSLQTFSCSTQT